MNEADVRREIYGLLRRMGYWPIRGRDAVLCPKCGTQVLPEIGRPDILVLRPLGLNRVLEVKVVRGTSFKFNLITDKQRRWMSAWLEDDGIGYLAIGTLSRLPDRKIWIVPWDKWLEFESKVREHQRSAPVDVENGKYKLALREGGLGMVQSLNEYELVYKLGKWEVPDGHSLASEWGAA